MWLARMENAPGRSELVALKRVRADLRNDEGVLEQFAREGDLCSRLKHPNIIALRALGSDAQGPFLALELAEGRSAAALLKQEGALPLPAVWCLSQDVARALLYAHHLENSEGVLHRDVAGQHPPHAGRRGEAR